MCAFANAGTLHNTTTKLLRQNQKHLHITVMHRPCTPLSTCMTATPGASSGASGWNQSACISIASAGWANERLRISQNHEPRSSEYTLHNKHHWTVCIYRYKYIYILIYSVDTCNIIYYDLGRVVALIPSFRRTCQAIWAVEMRNAPGHHHTVLKHTPCWNAWCNCTNLQIRHWKQVANSEHDREVWRSRVERESPPWKHISYITPLAACISRKFVFCMLMFVLQGSIRYLLCKWQSNIY